jgi:cholestenol Delta-isomerase
VKCDNLRPHCVRCTSTHRVCDGYPPPELATLSRDALAATIRNLSAVGPASLVLSGPRAHDNAACFDFFRLRTAPHGAAFFPSSFWQQQVLQVAHAEPAVWHAVAALGALHRRWSIFVANGGRIEWSSGSEGSASSQASSPDDHREVTQAMELAEQFANQAAVEYGRAMGLAKEIDRVSPTFCQLHLAPIYHDTANTV